MNTVQPNSSRARQNACKNEISYLYRQLIANISKRNVGEEYRQLDEILRILSPSLFHSTVGIHVYILLKLSLLQSRLTCRIFTNRTCTEINVLMFLSYILGRFLINGQPIYIFSSVFAIFIVISAVFLKFSLFFCQKSQISNVSLK